MYHPLRSPDPLRRPDARPHRRLPAAPARFAFRAVTLATHRGKALWPSRDLIHEILHSCVYHADTLSVTSLALPLLGTGTGGFPTDVCLDTMFQFWARTLLRGVATVRDVRIVRYA